MPREREMAMSTQSGSEYPSGRKVFHEDATNRAGQLVKEAVRVLVEGYHKQDEPPRDPDLLIHAIEATFLVDCAIRVICGFFSDQADQSNLHADLQFALFNLTQGSEEHLTDFVHETWVGIDDERGKDYPFLYQLPRDPIPDNCDCPGCILVRRAPLGIVMVKDAHGNERFWPNNGDGRNMLDGLVTLDMMYVAEIDQQNGRKIYQRTEKSK